MTACITLAITYNAQPTHNIIESFLQLSKNRRALNAAAMEWQRLQVAAFGLACLGLAGEHALGGPVPHCPACAQFPCGEYPGGG